MLSVSVPSHCELMRPAAEKLARELERIAWRQASIPVIRNVDVAPYGDAASMQDGLARQLYSPVRWVETVRYLVGQGVDTVIECGPGKVLTGLTRRIDKSISAKPIETPETLAAAVQIEELKRKDYK
jgi:[acyl-carrier-protein] S-malonyltransferase